MVFKTKTNVLSTGHRALEGVSQLIEIDRRITQDRHLQIPSPKTIESLRLNHRGKEELP